MNRQRKNILKLAAKKMAVLLLISATTVSSFATLGDGNKKNNNRSILSGRTSYKPGFFSLRSGYNFRGNQVLSNTSAKKYISINTTVSIQRGNSTMIVPLKKTVVVGGTGGVKINLGRR